jgi:hypothetical protein
MYIDSQLSQIEFDHRYASLDKDVSISRILYCVTVPFNVAHVYSIFQLRKITSSVSKAMNMSESRSQRQSCVVIHSVLRNKRGESTMT